ncbi:hypothetical protein [Pseudoalteromonas sp. S16_S37]|uniref:hypothetical protein n=1 Tax=Pseudoalteromonas sp. S16_S37 TaxID=2720228 RepID=UPI00168048FF|nr:hypothetical protein [Pseudoalteromonas sp. S16_S37]MBD1583128.1 hypothetical protein [Pseudoalteromonas sp. S16_S37]
MFTTLRERLKRYFITGAKPTQAQFAEFLDAALIQSDDGITKQASAAGQILAFSLPEHHQANTVFQQSVCIQGDLIVEGQLLGAPSSSTTTTPTNQVYSAPVSQHAGYANTQSASIPIGCILLYCGVHIPEGFLACDGLNGTPNLAPLVDNPVQPIRYIIKMR